MKKTDFTNATKDYFSNYLPNARGLSQNTIDSYRDTLKLLLIYFSDCQKIEAENIKIAHLTLENISGFLDWLETNRHVGISTRNQRQAAIQAFVKYIRYRYPEYLSNYYDILSMKAKKKP